MEQGMSSLEESGFLSFQIHDYVEAIRSRHSESFSVLASINRFAQELQYKLDVKPDNVQSIVCGTLYARTLSTYQAAIIVAERGMIPQARMLLRCLLESLFSLVAISKSTELAKKFINADERQRLKMFNKVQSWKADNLREIAKQSTTDVTKESIEQAIKEKNAKSISVEQMAIKAGLHDWYLTAYAVFSGSVHTSVRDLETHLVLDKDRNIISLTNEPSEEGLDRLLLTAAEAMLHALKAAERQFNVSAHEFVQTQYTELQRLKGMIKG
jgi:hypothetical protein